jgi:hypothetical protein
MEIKTKSTRMHSLIALYDMHTDFFRKAIAGISDKDAANRLNTKANHMQWIAGSMLQERFGMNNTLAGTDLKQSADELFKNYQGIKDGTAYPPLADYLNDWDRISPVYRETLLNITDEKLDSEFDMEGMKMSHYELLTFMMYREANMIGQLALWRRLLGYDAIKYD